MSHFEPPGPVARARNVVKSRSDEEAPPLRPRRPPPPNARCPRCGSAELSSLPTFSTGEGLAYRPIAEDVLCRHCSFIGLPELTEEAAE
ncbi:MAG TPA: hypothetical protein VFB38_10470 [Chthonomonadaceae bacterium]|nr:hypothetical protein [Chthonomonadaceae bacterium]